VLDFAKPTPPSDDKRWRIVQVQMRKHGHSPHALIETLHAVQDAFGYLDRDSLQYVAVSLRLPLSKVYGVATFYHYFTLKPQGKHTCVICTGTACYIKGVPELLTALKEKHGVGLGETTRDGELSVLSARCVGACGLAPVAVIDGQVAGKLTANSLIHRIDEVIHRES
jgi:bidirectional [NiFe] hydrogenase diaphorase subunit